MTQIIVTPSQLGQMLRRFRKEKKLSQASVASLVSLLPKTVSRLETRTESATVDSLFKLLSALELELTIQIKPNQSSDLEW